MASKYYVEFGTEDGSQCNTRVLREWLSWQGLLMDGSHERPEINLRRQVVTPDNINALLTTYVLESATASGRPHDRKAVIDVLSIDLDFSDWWVAALPCLGWGAAQGPAFPWTPAWAPAWAAATASPCWCLDGSTGLPDGCSWLLA